MTAQELRDYILKEMTAEEAVLKFIQTSIEHYEKLKLETGASHEGNPFLIMTAAAMDLGWNLAIEKTNSEDDLIEGISFGTEDYLNRVLKD